MECFSHSVSLKKVYGWRFKAYFVITMSANSTVAPLTIASWRDLALFKKKIGQCAVMAPDDGRWFFSFCRSCRGASIHLRIPWYLGFLITLLFVMLFTVNIEIKSHQSHHTLLSHATWTIWGNASSTQNLSFRVFRIELWKPVGGLPTYRFSWMQQGSFGQSDQLPVRI